LHKKRPKGQGKGEGKSQGRAALSEEQKKQAKVEKKAAKKLQKKEAKAANPQGKPAKPKAKPKAKGRAQGRVGIEVAPEDLVAGDVWEDEETIYTFVEPEMVYENDEWFFDHDTQKWWGAYVDDDEQPNGGSPCSR
jgi:hypothetical protein